MADNSQHSNLHLPPLCPFNLCAHLLKCANTRLCGTRSGAVPVRAHVHKCPGRDVHGGVYERDADAPSCPATALLFADIRARASYTKKIHRKRADMISKMM